jgi:uncharacterized RDD family membrane protein YckC
MFNASNKLTMKTADKGTRLGNFMIDSFVFVILLVFQLTILIVLFPNIKEDSPLLNVYISILYFSYYFLFEFILGRTPGKYLTRTTVVNFKGKKPSVKYILIRSICRLIPVDGFSYIFSLTGFHDTISRTTVVYK